MHGNQASIIRPFNGRGCLQAGESGIIGAIYDIAKKE
jgi:hypothetical protein